MYGYDDELHPGPVLLSTELLFRFNSFALLSLLVQFASDVLFFDKDDATVTNVVSFSVTTKNTIFFSFFFFQTSVDFIDVRLPCCRSTTSSG